MKRKFLVVGAFGTVVLVLLAAWFFSGGDINEYAGRLEEVRAAAKAEGLPLSLSEVDTRGTLAVHLNAAPLIATAHAATEKVGREYEAPEDDGIDALRSSLEGFEEAISSWSAAAGVKECKFERDWELGIEVFFPELEQLKDGARLLLADARLGRMEEDLERWKSRVAEARQLARHAATDPTIIAGLVKLAIDDMVLSEIATTLLASSGSKEAIEACQALLDEPYGVEDILYSLRFESATVYRVLDEFRRKKFKERFAMAFSRQATFSYPLHINADAANEAAWLETMMVAQSVISDHPNDWPGLLDALAGFEEKHVADYDPSHRIVAQFFWLPEQLVQSYCKAEALRRILFVSAVAYEHQRINRQFPGQMPVLGELGTDPFTGQPLKYDDLGLGFAVYSVGQDRADDGGLTEPGLTMNGSDLGFRFEPTTIRSNE